MSGFEPQTSGIGSNHSTNWTTTIALTVCDPAEQTVLDIRWTEQKIASIFVVVLNERKRERERERERIEKQSEIGRRTTTTRWSYEEDEASVN